jgi:hypothetical protein
MYLKLIACEVAVRELSWCVAKAKNDILPNFLDQGYHGDVENGRKKIQEHIDASETGTFDAILLGYALCNNMLEGVQARSKPLIVARAHDCITWFLGSRKRYTEEFAAHPGSYYYTAGWLSTRQPIDQGNNSMGGGTGIGGRSWDDIVEKYGEDNAQYLWEMENSWIRNYTHGSHIKFDLSEELSQDVEQRVREICERNDWEYAERKGDMGLLQRWLDGPWDSSEFLRVEPGEEIRPSYDDRVIQIARPGKQKVATG